jgi:hypothetical protein
MMLLALAASAQAADVNLSEHRFAGGARWVGRPVVDGIEVLGAAQVLATDPAGDVRWERPPPPLPAQRWVGIDVRRAVAAVEPVTAAFGPAMWTPRAERAWWWRDGALVPVWAVDLATASPPTTWRLLVAAADGRALALTQTSRTARGRVYPVSPAKSEVALVELPNLRSDVALVGAQVVASSCDAWTRSDSLFGLTTCDAGSGHAIPNGDGDYLYPPDPSGLRDPFAEVNAYYHVDRMSSWLADCCGLSLPYAPIRANVNFEWANAFFGDFDGDGVPDVSFGQDEVTGVDLGYDGDVVYHELGHAVVGVLAPELGFVAGDGVGLQWAPGAVNEGAADIWAMLMTGDPQVGEYAGAAFDQPAIRDLSALRRCPDDLGGEVHLDGEILASFGWALIDDPRVGPEVVRELLLGATPLWGPGLDWAGVGESLAVTADDLLAASAIDGATHARIAEVLDESGLVGCGRVVSLAPGVPVVQYLLTGGLAGDLERLPGGVGLSIDVPDAAVAVSIDVSEFLGDPELGWAVYGRVGEPVGHEFTVIDAIGLGFAVPTVYDWLVDGEGAERFEVPALPRGETLYLSVSSRNLGGLAPFVFDFGRITLAVEVEEATAPLAPEAAAGCGCATGPRSWPLGALLFGMFLGPTAARATARSAAARTSPPARTPAAPR